METVAQKLEQDLKELNRHLASDLARADMLITLKLIEYLRARQDDIALAERIMTEGL